MGTASAVRKPPRTNDRLQRTNARAWSRTKQGSWALPDRSKIGLITTQEALLFSQELRDEEKTGKIVAVWLALTTGIRRSEALALVWDDIDLEGKRLHARRQFGKEKTLDLLSRIRTSYHSWK